MADEAEGGRNAATSSPDIDERVLVFHTFGRSADVICRLLASNGFTCEKRADVPLLAEAVKEGAGAVVVGENVLTDDCTAVRAALDAQPPWSDLPFVVLVPHGHVADSMSLLADILGKEASLSVLEQPARKFEIVSFVEAALRTRRRQYEIRSHLERERTLRAEVESGRRRLEELNRTLETRVEERSSQVRDLSRALTRAEQKERRRIAQILHDDLQQRLYAVQMKIRIAREEVGEGRRQDAVGNLDAAGDLIRATVDVARNLTTDLSPPVLSTEGLTGTLEWVVAQMQELYGLTVDLEAPHAFRMPDEDMRILLFQTIRELLFNVVKHAETNRARVELSDANDHVRIDVVDEGRGFDLTEFEARGAGETSFGLFRARERIRLFGGSLNIDSRPGRGTRVRINLPVHVE